MTSQSPLHIKVFQQLARLALPGLLFATAFMGAPAQAASTDTSANVPYYTDLSLNEQSTIQTNYNKLQTEITAAKAKAVDIRIRLNAGDTKVTEADYTEALKAVTKLQETADSIYAYIHEDDGKPTTGTNTGSSGGSGSSGEESEGEQSPFQQIGQQLLGQLLGGGLNNFGGLTGGNTGGLTSGLTGGDTGTNTGNTGGYTTPKTPEQIAADKAAADKAAKEKAKEEKERAAACAPATTDTAPGKTEDDGGASVVKVSGKEADDDINAGGSVEKASANATAAAKAKTAADAKKKAEDRKKFNCDIPLTGTDVNTPNPNGKATAINSMADAEAIVAAGKFVCDPAKLGEKYCRENGMQCAALTKTLCPNLGMASGWSGGTLVKGSNIATGTCIATANAPGNKYCKVYRMANGNLGCGNPGGGITHTAVYISQNEEGIQVLDQYTDQPPQIRTIPWKGTNKISGDMYKTIMTNGGNALLDTIPVLQPVAIALGYTSGMGLSKL